MKDCHHTLVTARSALLSCTDESLRFISDFDFLGAGLSDAQAGVSSIASFVSADDPMRAGRRRGGPLTKVLLSFCFVFVGSHEDRIHLLCVVLRMKAIGDARGECSRTQRSSTLISNSIPYLRMNKVYLGEESKL